MNNSLNVFFFYSSVVLIHCLFYIKDTWPRHVFRRRSLSGRRHHRVRLAGGNPVRKVERKTVRPATLLASGYTRNAGSSSLRLRERAHIPEGRHRAQPAADNAEHVESVPEPAAERAASPAELVAEEPVQHLRQVRRQQQQLAAEERAEVEGEKAEAGEGEGQDERG